MHIEGGTHRTRCPHKAVHTEGGLWPPQESCYLGGHRQGGTHRMRCPHKAVHTKGGLWPLQESCYLKSLRGGLCFFKRHMGWGGYRNEPAVRPADSAGRTAAEFFGRGPRPAPQVSRWRIALNTPTAVCQFHVVLSGHKAKSTDAQITQVLQRIATRRRLAISGFPLQVSLCPPHYSGPNRSSMCRALRASQAVADTRTSHGCQHNA